MARAARAANPNRGVPVNSTGAPAPIPIPSFVPTPGTAPPAYYSDSEEENMAGLTGYDVTINPDPLVYRNAFKESEFILRQAMKARITKQGTRTDEELLAFQTDQVIEAAQLNVPHADAKGHGAADQHSRPWTDQSRHAHAE